MSPPNPSPISGATRFAPSPTGHLHLGHAYSALLTWDTARAEGWRIVLRIEDIDTGRCRPEFTDAIFEDLAWLGLDWEQPVRNQSEHMADYEAALARLRDQDLLYPCFCSRRDIREEITAIGGAPHDWNGAEGPVYPGTCRGLSPGERAGRVAAGDPFALRLDVAAALRQTGPLTWRDLDRGAVPVALEGLGDVVLARKDIPTSYHLSVTVDDALQGITHVIRGQDLEAATHIHRLLQALLDLPSPAYRHHTLLTGPDGKRYAKRDKSITLRSLREAGKTPADIREMVGLA